MLQGVIFSKLQNALQIVLISYYFNDNGYLFSLQTYYSKLFAQGFSFQRCPFKQNISKYYGSLMNRTCNIPPESVFQLSSFQRTGQMTQQVQRKVKCRKKRIDFSSQRFRGHPHRMYAQHSPILDDPLPPCTQSYIFYLYAIVRIWLDPPLCVDTFYIFTPHANARNSVRMEENKDHK